MVLPRGFTIAHEDRPDGEQHDQEYRRHDLGPADRHGRRCRAFGIDIDAFRVAQDIHFYRLRQSNEARPRRVSARAKNFTWLP